MDTANGVWSVGNYYVEYGSPLFFAILAFILGTIGYIGWRFWAGLSEDTRDSVADFRNDPRGFLGRYRVETERRSDTSDDS